jgi:hypothetical protein
MMHKDWERLDESVNSTPIFLPQLARVFLKKLLYNVFLAFEKPKIQYIKNLPLLDTVRKLRADQTVASPLGISFVLNKALLIKVVDERADGAGPAATHQGDVRTRFSRWVDLSKSF